MKKIMFNDRYGLTKAVLDGRKTMTRRVIPLTDVDRHYLDKAFDWDFREMVISDRYSRYMVNEIVAVAQSYHALNKSGYVAPEWLEHTCESSAGYENKMFVRADLMPHRIRITNIKVERLQDISHEDCLKEGLSIATVNNGQGNYGYHTEYNLVYYDNFGRTKIIGGRNVREVFADLIDRVCGKGTWDSNPYVFVYEFELMKGGEQ
ncbi:MAG: hypothetical protein K6C10_07380 [Prevotella sp.]|nr:hypothetical protein [Prevotella sp.]